MMKSIFSVGTIGMVLLLAIGLFGDSSLIEGAGLGDFGEWILDILQDPHTQYLAFAWLVFNCLAMLILRLRLDRQKPGCYLSSRVWLVALMSFGTIVYAWHYSSAFKISPLPVTVPIIYLAGALLGQVAAAWVWGGRSRRANRRAMCLICICSGLIAMASIWQSESGAVFKYAGVHRFSGVWNNPNIYGLLAASGGLLLLGLALARLAQRQQLPEVGSMIRWQSGVGITVWFAALVILGYGLVGSYSRGAWVAGICGLGYLTSQVAKDRFWKYRSLTSGPSSQMVLCLREGKWIFAILLLLIMTLLYWHSSDTESLLRRRAFSVFNFADFSWRNRIATWEGALQITADYPLLGAGWNCTPLLYYSYYMPPRMIQSASIQMNDYFMLGSTLGIPGLYAFGIYIWVLLSKASGPSRLNILLAAYRSAVIVLLVGFWFDGGLFKLATASLFWTLLEAGNPMGRRV